ncbi:arginine--tRNA ligase [soil metagenome]
MRQLQEAITRTIKELFDVEIVPKLSRTDEQFGDYSTNAAMRLAGNVDQPPPEIAEKLVSQLREELNGVVEEITVAGPGFINFKLSSDKLLEAAFGAPRAKSDLYTGKTVVAEYSDPNPFKVLHAGHLYTCVVGDAIANLLQAAGGSVHRVNFGGDVGLHVARNMWAIIKFLGGENPEKLDEVEEHRRADWLSERYVEGSSAYEKDETAKAEIIAINKRVYRIHEEQDNQSPFAQIYWTCRSWSYAYFDDFYERIGVSFEKYYPESETAPGGLQIVTEQLEKGVYEKSDGAVVFNGEKHGLHTRVFVTSQGLPTYETKDVGLIMAKWRDYKFDTSVVITGNDIVEYMKVVLKSVEQFAPELVQATIHLTHGMVKLVGGANMSSRKGNILRAIDVLDAAAIANKELNGKDSEEAMLAAVKYAFLKQRIGGDIIYDPKESVAIEGNSGPYIQYAHARARSILAKSSDDKKQITDNGELEPGERSLARKISEYPEVVEQATKDLMPHHICTYLYELAVVFNRFYEKSRVIGDEREELRLRLVSTYADTLKSGLGLLGIVAPERM